MDTKKLLWLPLGVVAVLCATCAPVAERPEDKGTTAPKEKPGEAIQAPRPVDDPTRVGIEAAIQNVRDRQMYTTTGFWTVFHGILGLGPGVMLKDPETGKLHNAVEYICAGHKLKGLYFIQTEYGLDVETARDISNNQGHQDQFICEMGQWGMPADKEFVVRGKKFTAMDFVNHSQMHASTSATRGQELSWAVPLLAQYKGLETPGAGVDLPPWENEFGEKVTFEDMVRYEVNAPVEDAACGGTHRLFGLTWAYHLHLRNGGKTEGVWKDVAERTRKYIDLAKKYQNPDGMFSTNYFREKGDAWDKEARISTTGHILEWLALALSDEEIKEKWVERAAAALSHTIRDLQNQSVSGGSLYHAVHGLQIYYARRYGKTDFPMPKELMYPQPPREGEATSR